MDEFPTVEFLAALQNSGWRGLGTRVLLEPTPVSLTIEVLSLPRIPWASTTPQDRLECHFTRFPRTVCLSYVQTESSTMAFWSAAVDSEEKLS